MNTSFPKYLFSVLSGLALLLSASLVSATVIETSVEGSANLYYDDWGHAFNVSGGGNHDYALGRGAAAIAVGHEFTVGAAVDITATGCVVDAGSACTGPDGLGGSWRGLDVYALIGIWSSDANSIVPVGNAFLVGSSLNTVAQGAYLFLAENNGVHEDNHSGAYEVTITTVPEPGTLAMLALGLIGLGLGRKRISQ